MKSSRLNEMIESIKEDWLVWLVVAVIIASAALIFAMT